MKFQYPYFMKWIYKVHIFLILVSSVSAQPTVTSFSPKFGTIGSSVTINGLGFNTNPSANFVWVGPVKAKIINATNSQLIIQVPQGASNGIISVTTNNLTGYSSNIFYTSFRNKNLSDTLLLGGEVIISDTSSTHGNNITPYSFADIDGDGKPDIIQVANASNGSAKLLIHRNISTGLNIKFSATPEAVDLPKFNSTIGYFYSQVSVNDFDGDGTQDIFVFGITTISTTEFSVCLVARNSSKIGSISFSFLDTTFSAASRILSSTVNDFDKDGRPDVVLANDKGGITSLRNIANNTKVKFDQLGGRQYPNRIYSITDADLNNDGKSEVLSDSYSLGLPNAYFSFYPNKSTVGFINFTTTNFYNPTSRYSSTRLGVKARDMDNDGKTDICFLSRGQSGFLSGPSLVNSLSIFKNNSIGDSILLNPPKEFFFDSLIKGAVAMTVDDLNGDQLPDVILARSDTNCITIFRNRFSGNTLTFSPPQHISFSPGSKLIVGLEAKDVNGDGIPDIIVRLNNGSLYVIPNITGFSDTSYSSSIEGVTNQTSFRVWPNPTNNYLNVEKHPAVGQQFIDILNSSGVRVIHIKPNNTVAVNAYQINISMLSAGSYFVRLYNEGGTLYTKQFIKN